MDKERVYEARREAEAQAGRLVIACAALEKIANADVRYEREGHGMAHLLYGEDAHGRFGFLGSAAPALQTIARKALKELGRYVG